MPPCKQASSCSSQAFHIQGFSVAALTLTVYGCGIPSTNLALGAAHADEDVVGLPCISASDQVIAVLAPAGTTLEVPEPAAAEDGGARQYRQASCSPRGIAAFLQPQHLGMLSSVSCTCIPRALCGAGWGTHSRAKG